MKNEMKILITGGTGGIGSNIVKSLIKEGHQVKIWDIDPERFENLKKEISTNQENLSFEKVDVSDQTEVQKASGKIPKLDIMINAAAVLWPVEPFMESNLEKLEKSMKISLWGTIYACHSLIPILKKSQNGKIVNFGGGGAANARENHMAYGLSKTAVVRFTENLALENPEICVNAIAPGAQKTNMWNDEKHDEEPEKWGDMNALMEFVKFLISEKSNGITGRFINYKDDWNKPDFIEKIKSDPNFLTLRRIDDFQFTKMKKKL